MVKPKWIRKINLTGGNAGVIAENIKQSSQIFVEFDAASKGLGILLKEQGHHINQYIFANIGTGTSLHYYNGHHQERVGGIGTGGGMIRGLVIYWLKYLIMKHLQISLNLEIEILSI